MTLAIADKESTRNQNVWLHRVREVWVVSIVNLQYVDENYGS